MVALIGFVGLACVFFALIGLVALIGFVGLTRVFFALIGLVGLTRVFFALIGLVAGLLIARIGTCFVVGGGGSFFARVAMIVDDVKIRISRIALKHLDIALIATSESHCGYRGHEHEKDKLFHKTTPMDYVRIFLHTPKRYDHR